MRTSRSQRFLKRKIGTVLIILIDILHAIGPLTTHTCRLVPRTCVRESTGMASSFRELETWTKYPSTQADTSGHKSTRSSPIFVSHGTAAVLAMFQGQSERHNPLQNPGLASHVSLPPPPESQHMVTYQGLQRQCKQSQEYRSTCQISSKLPCPRVN